MQLTLYLTSASSAAAVTVFYQKKPLHACSALRTAEEVVFSFSTALEKKYQETNITEK